MTDSPWFLVLFGLVTGVAATLGILVAFGRI
jgi:hypothetical protein